MISMTSTYIIPKYLEKKNPHNYFSWHYGANYFNIFKLQDVDDIPSDKQQDFEPSFENYI